MDGVFTREVIEATGATSIRDATNRLLAKHLARDSTTRMPDLKATCSKLRVTDVKVADIPHEGALVPEKDGTYQIWLSSRSSWARRRFSLAHELGHAILHNLLPHTRQFETRTLFTAPGNCEEEAICDRLAAAMLMPEGMFLRDASMFARVELEEMRLLAQKYRVSLTAAAVRYSEVAPGDPFAIVHFQFDRQAGQSFADRIVVNFRSRAIRLDRGCPYGREELPTQAFLRHRTARGRFWVRSAYRNEEFEACVESPRSLDDTLAILRREPQEEHDARIDKGRRKRSAMTRDRDSFPDGIKGHGIKGRAGIKGRESFSAAI